jgi:AbrB family looped-hinge helix DNA binding protein
MATSIVSEKGWVVIPKAIRERYGLKKGSKVSIVDWGGTIYLFPVPDDPIAHGHGLFKGDDSADIMREFLEEKRKEREREEREIERWGKRHTSD